MGVIRSGDWKLLEYFEDGRLELYNLRDDIGEKKNLSAIESKTARGLHAQLTAWREAIAAPLPQLNTERTDKPRSRNRRRGNANAD